MHTYTSVLWCCVVYTHLLHEFGINNRIGYILSCISGAGCCCWRMVMQENFSITKLRSSQTNFFNMTVSSLYSNGLNNHQNSIQNSSFGRWCYRGFPSLMQLANLHQLCDDIMSIWTKISEGCFQNFVESMPQIIKVALDVKRKSNPLCHTDFYHCLLYCIRLTLSGWCKEICWSCQ